MPIPEVCNVAPGFVWRVMLYGLEMLLVGIYIGWKEARRYHG